MGQVSAASTTLINAEPTAATDYETVRPKNHPVPCTAAESTGARGRQQAQCQVAAAGVVRDAGNGRCRHTVIERHEFVHGHQLDGRFPLPTRSSVTVNSPDRRAVSFFEKTFAPLGLKKIQAEALRPTLLKTELEGDAWTMRAVGCRLQWLTRLALRPGRATPRTRRWQALGGPISAESAFHAPPNSTRIDGYWAQGSGRPSPSAPSPTDGSPGMPEARSWSRMILERTETEWTGLYR